MINTFHSYGINSEYRLLKAVLLCRPGLEIEQIDNPKDVLHIRKVDYAIIGAEYEQIIKLYNKLKIKVYFVDSNRIGDVDKRCLFNMMYTRDLLFMTPEGVIISKMAYGIRCNEVDYVEKTIKDAGIPIIKNIEGNATFEGSDALWVKNNLVIVGVGNRTNVEGFLQVRNALNARGITCISVPVPKDTLHLLGAVQFVDSDTVLVRVDLVDLEIIEFLKREEIKIVNVPESEEVRERQAMNIVTVAPREIVMPVDCPETRKIYQNCGIKIVAEMDIRQLINGGGGLACSTAVIARSF